MNQHSRTMYSTLDSLSAVAKNLLHHIDQSKVCCIEGPMGAGKTTLIKALCKQLGVQDHVSSPTFSLIHEYATAAGDPVYHFDFYRLQEEEVRALDCMEYFDSSNYCFIEWASKIPNLLPPVYYQVHINAQPDGRRRLQIHLRREGHIGRSLPGC